MDDIAVGRVFREIRIRLGWPQRMVAARAGVSTTTYSDIERGHLDGVVVGKARRVAAVLEVRLLLEPRWRGAALDHIVASRHAAMTEAVAATLVAAGTSSWHEATWSSTPSADGGEVRQDASPRRCRSRSAGCGRHRVEAVSGRRRSGSVRRG